MSLLMLSIIQHVEFFHSLRCFINMNASSYTCYNCSALHHRRNLWGYEGTGTLTFWTGISYPTFQDTGEEFAVNCCQQSDLRGLNYTKTVLAGVTLRTPLGKLVMLPQPIVGWVWDTPPISMFSS